MLDKAHVHAALCTAGKFWLYGGGGPGKSGLQPRGAVPLAAGDMDLMREGAVSNLQEQLKRRQAELGELQRQGARLASHKLLCAIIVPDMRMYEYFLK